MSTKITAAQTGVWFERQAFEAAELAFYSNGGRPIKASQPLVSRQANGMSFERHGLEMTLSAKGGQPIDRLLKECSQNKLTGSMTAIQTGVWFERKAFEAAELEWFKTGGNPAMI